LASGPDPGEHTRRLATVAVEAFADAIGVVQDDEAALLAVAGITVRLAADGSATARVGDSLLH
jgi:hypothetical protein